MRKTIVEPVCNRVRESKSHPLAVEDFLLEVLGELLKDDTDEATSDWVAVGEDE